MSDDNKTDNAEEPIDVEFETMETERNAGATKRGDVKPKPAGGGATIIFALVIVIIIMALAGWFFVFKSAGQGKEGSEAPQIATLTSRLADLQSALNTVEQKQKDGETADATMAARVTALEQADSANQPNDQQVADLQTRMMALESALPIPAFDPAIIAGLGARLDDLERQARSVVSGVGPDDASVPAAVLQALQARIAVLEAAASDPVLDMQSSARFSGLEDALAQLQSRIVALEEQSQSEGTGLQNGLALGILTLDNAAQNGSPFAAEWLALATLLPTNADIIVLERLSQTGVPSRSSLARRFADEAERIRAAQIEAQIEVPKASDAPPKPGMLARAKNALGGLVSVRRVGDPANGPATGVESILMQTQAALDDDDLGAAVKILSGLQGDTLAAAQNWLTQANARLTVEQSLNRLKLLASTAAEVNP